MQGNRDRVQAGANHADGTVKICPNAIHFVDKTDTWHAVIIRLPPNSFRLGFDTSNGIEDDDTTIQNAQTALDFGREVNVAGGVNDVDLVVEPHGCGRGRGDGNPALLFLDHMIHRRRAIMYLTHFMDHARVIQDTLRSGRLACINMSNNPDIANFFYGITIHVRPHRGAISNESLLKTPLFCND